jgi:hypothetical protein
MGQKYTSCNRDHACTSCGCSAGNVLHNGKGWPRRTNKRTSEGGTIPYLCLGRPLSLILFGPLSRATSESRSRIPPSRSSLSSKDMLTTSSSRSTRLSACCRLIVRWLSSSSSALPSATALAGIDARLALKGGSLLAAVILMLELRRSGC